MTLAFASDYQEGCHPEILEALNKTNSEKTEGYGTDSYSALAKAKILEACGIDNGEVYLLVGPRPMKSAFQASLSLMKE